MGCPCMLKCCQGINDGRKIQNSRPFTATGELGTTLVYQESGRIGVGVEKRERRRREERRGEVGERREGDGERKRRGKYTGAFLMEARPPP